MNRIEISGQLVLDERVAAGTLMVEDGVIVDVELRDEVEEDFYIAPGFIDVHIHGCGGYDCMRGVDDIGGMARHLAGYGVTSFLPTAVTAPLERLERFAEDVRIWMAGQPPHLPQVLGFHLEGPFIAPGRRGAHNPRWILSPAGVDEQRLQPLMDGLRLVTIAPELPGALDLIRRVVAAGATVSLGHSDATLEQAIAGYRAGAMGTTHLFNAMSPIRHRDPGLALSALLDDRVYVELIADGYHVEPSVWPLVWRCKPEERVVLMSDALSLAESGQRYAHLGDLEVEVQGGRAVIVPDGPLAGSTTLLNTALRNVVSNGLNLPRAIASATHNPARLIGAKDRGRLAPGLRADIVKLDQDLRVVSTMVAGRWVASGGRSGDPAKGVARGPDRSPGCPLRIAEDEG